MRDLNRVQLRGRLGADPAFKVVNNQSLATFSVATGEKWKDDGGAEHERVEWHDVAVWGRAAEWVRDNLKKGALVSVEGSLKYSTFEKGGAKVRRAEISAWEVHAVAIAARAPSSEAAH